MDGAFLELNAEDTEAEVEEFSRDMYKLFKVFNTKAKQMKKDRDVGGGVSYQIVYVRYFIGGCGDRYVVLLNKLKKKKCLLL